MMRMTISRAGDLLENFEALANIDRSPELKKAMLDSAEEVAQKARDNLDDMVYNKPLPPGKTRSGDLKEKTKAVEEIEVKGNKVIACAGTDDYRAQFIQLGTGYRSKGKKIRITPWVYRDADGEFHTTSGQAPRPYLTKALKDTKNNFLESLLRAIMTIPKNPT